MTTQSQPAELGLHFAFYWHLGKLYTLSLEKSEREVVVQNPHNNVWESQAEFTREWTELVNQSVARSHDSQLILARCSSCRP